MRFRRRPMRVRAEALTEPWEWQTAGGDRLVARPGDYRLTDLMTHAQWSVSPEALKAAYRLLEGDEYESRGDVDARRLHRGAEAEEVLTTEGSEWARPGDWVVRDSEDHTWVVSDRAFRSRYIPGSVDAAAEMDR